MGNRCPDTEQCAPRAWLHVGFETKAEEAAFCKLKEWGRACWAHFPKAFRHCQLQDTFQTVPETCFLLVGSWLISAADCPRCSYNNPEDGGGGGGAGSVA